MVNAEGKGSEMNWDNEGWSSLLMKLSVWTLMNLLCSPLMKSSCSFLMKFLCSRLMKCLCSPLMKCVLSVAFLAEWLGVEYWGICPTACTRVSDWCHVTNECPLTLQVKHTHREIYGISDFQYILMYSGEIITRPSSTIFNWTFQVVGRPILLDPPTVQLAWCCGQGNPICDRPVWHDRIFAAPRD